MHMAVIQMVSQDDIGHNLERAYQLLQQAADGGAQLAVLPENFAAMGRRDIARIGIEEFEGRGPILPWLKNVCRTLKLWLVAGTVALPYGTDQKPCASSLLIDDQGQLVARYDKLHLFEAKVADSRGMYREADDYAFGQKLVYADTPVGRLGLSVCYDLRFAELYSALRAAGCELISAPSAFTHLTGAAHWDVLIRARAIETQCYMLAAGQGGVHPGPRQTYGHSAIVDPWGRVLAQIPQGEAVLIAQRDPLEQSQIRERMPVFSHRRFSQAALIEGA